MGNFVQDTEYDVHMYTMFHDVFKYRYFYTNLILFYLFSIYIIYYYETILILQGYDGQKLWGFLWTLSMLWGVTYKKSNRRTCRNKLIKFNYCRAKKCNSY
jgi:hypothetical protein